MDDASRAASSYRSSNPTTPGRNMSDAFLEILCAIRLFRLAAPFRPSGHAYTDIAREGEAA